MESRNARAASADRDAVNAGRDASTRTSEVSTAARWGLVVGVAVSLLQAPNLTAAERLRGPLVTAQWLGSHLEDADVLILDASPAQSYSAQHIPRAVHADLLSYGVKEKPAAEMKRLYESWGIRKGKKVVLYDQGGTFFATRLFFALYYHGFPARDLFVLDGGLSKWQEEGLPVTKDVTAAPTNGSFKLGAFREDVRVRLPEFLTASGDPANNALVEALDPTWHFGGVPALERSGHVPHAILLPAGDFYRADKTFKSRDEIRKMLVYLGVRPEQNVYTHCGGGVAASVPFFALRFLLDYPKVKLYTESQMGWLSDERQLPFWTYDVPSLMRTAPWLRFWGGPMLRTYGGVDVSIVDVRPAAEFNQGHVAFALNLPADVFKNNLGTPERLAGFLGAAGIDPSHEAVVLSGAGLTRDAALAFVMLQKIGQRKVSVLMESAAQWAELGLAMTQQGTIPPAAYSAKARESVIHDPASPQGLYPRVFIASGAAVPVKAPEGKVIHVPYTDLLDANGTPKAAKEIWNTLAKAGVSRYAQLVCFSEDPGEAAANYFVLELMGYPDVKMLVP